jgi:exopolyphosphatase/pppGpp-phosphohydrolase
MKNLKLYFTLVLLFFITPMLFSQENMFAGIEIGSKGIKMSIIDVYNIKKGNINVKSFWTENVAIAKSISIDGNMAPEDINRAITIINNNYNKIKTEMKVPDANIFIVASSGVAMAQNTQILANKVKAVTGKDLEFIEAHMEGKMLLKGCIPPVDYKNSIILDIGGGNTKGGYIDVVNNNAFVFFPLSLNYGSVTLTQSVIKQTRSEDLDEFNSRSFSFLPTLRDQVSAMYKSSPQALSKEKIYMSGGAVWAFYTLYKGVTKEPFNQFKLEDVINYDAILKNNFKKLEDLAKTDPEIEKVLKTYSQKYLISGSNILLVCLEALPNVNNKKLYFAKEGQIAWLISYIADRSKKVKKIY